ncbi:MAG: hypothetical protein WC073_12595 [Sterolibacterium sp.]
MAADYMSLLSDILRQSFLGFLWVGSIAGILLGAGLLFRPQCVVQLNQYLSRWVGSDKLMVLLDRPRWIERLMYRHHRLVGVGVSVGALVVLYTFSVRYNLRVVSAFVPHGYWWLVDALIGILLLGSALAALIGLVVLIRPSLLRDIELSANRWISTEAVHAVCNGMNFSLEQSLIRHHHVAGISILSGSLYVLVVLGIALFRGPW